MHNTVNLFFINVLNPLFKKLLPIKIYTKIRNPAIDVLWSIQYSNKKFRTNFSLKCLEVSQNSKILEVGGPSWIFKTELPIYRVCKSVDNVDWRDKHSLSEDIKTQNVSREFQPYRYYMFKTGGSLIAEASQIPVETASYDLVISAQVLEHLANPIKALVEWKRIIRNGGHIIVEVPRKDRTFDYQRDVTSIQHLLDDFEIDVGEHDLTHVDEVVELKHDFREPTYNTKEELREICLNNINNRLMHHHVFDLELLVETAKNAGFAVVDAVTTESGHVVLATKI